MRFLAALAVLASFGCRSAAAPLPQFLPGVDYIYLTTEFPSYGPGAEVTLRLMNPSQRQYGYNLCVTRLERLEDDRWVIVRPMLAEFCTMELRLLDAGGQASYTFTLDPAAPAGQYRFQTTLEDMQTGSRAFLASTTFAITPRGPGP